MFFLEDLNPSLAVAGDKYYGCPEQAAVSLAEIQ